MACTIGPFPVKIEGNAELPQQRGNAAQSLARAVLEEGQLIGAGERFGLIRFGSRLDVYLPETTRALVSEGQTAIAGETILADLGRGDEGRTFRTN